MGRDRDRDRSASRGSHASSDKQRDTGTDSHRKAGKDKHHSHTKKHGKDRRSRSRSRGRSSKKLKELKKESRKSHKDKKERKHSKKHHKDDKHHKKKRKRHDSDSSSDDSSSDSSTDESDRSPSRSRSSKRSRHRHHDAPKSSAAAAPSSIATPSLPVPPAPSPSAINRSLTLIRTLIEHGGGSEDESLQALQFIFFKLDKGHRVDVEGMADELARHVLAAMFRTCGLEVRKEEECRAEDDEPGWAIPVNPNTGAPAFSMLRTLREAFEDNKKDEESGAGQAAIGPAAPPPSLPTASSSTSDSASATDGADSTRILGPAMPTASDCEMAAQDEAEAEDGEGEGGMDFGPKMPQQMTQQELQAFARLRESREQLAALKEMGKEAGGGKERVGRESWMTSLPSLSGSGAPSAEAFVQLAAAGEKEALRGRSFQSSRASAAAHGSGGMDESWTLTPEEKARKDAERRAIRMAEAAVYSSARAVGSGSSGSGSGEGMSSGRMSASANASAAAAQAANDRMMARYKKQQVAMEDSLLAVHQKAHAAAASSSRTDSTDIFRWDREKEMGMRALKGTAALKKELQSAFSLADNFAPASS